jgi:hypothetical protein
MRWLKWLFEHHRDVFTPSILDTAPEVFNDQFRDLLKSILTPPIDQSLSPILFDRLECNKHFMPWIIDLKKKDQTAVGIGMLLTHRTALANLFRDFGVKMNEDFVRALEAYYIGLSKMDARSKSNGVTEIRQGKDPMPFDFYVFLAKLFLKRGGSESISAHTILTLSWNLMSRISNTSKICYSHLDWQQDSLAVYFGIMKNDQLAERPKDPRHVFANPFEPSICAVLSLGIYLLCSSVDGDNHLFKGQDPSARYSKTLARILQSEEGQQELDRRGMTEQQIGTHSARKGSATFATSGSTDAPSSVAVCLRAGWAMTGVQDTYFRYESAGDQHVGRTVAGLPPDLHAFSVLPPFFENEYDADVGAGIQLAFPGYPRNMMRVLQFCLASLVYHQDFLLDPENVSPKHRLHSTPLFLNRALLSSLKSKVACRNYELGDAIRPSGITVNAKIVSDLRELKETVAGLDKKIINGVGQVIEDKAVAANTVTYDGLQEVLKQFAAKYFHNGTGREEAAPPMTTEKQAYSLFSWGGSLRRVPKEFEVPQCTVQQAWVLFLCGNKSLGYPPFRILSHSDIYDTRQRKNFSNFVCTMRYIEPFARSCSLWLDDPSEVQAVEMFRHIEPQLDISDKTQKSRVRRCGEVCWSTMLNVIRANRKRLCEDQAE